MDIECRKKEREIKILKKLNFSNFERKTFNKMKIIILFFCMLFYRKRDSFIDLN